MVVKHHGKALGHGKLRQMAGLSREGVSLPGISEAAENVGFRTRGVQLNIDELLNDICCPRWIVFNKLSAGLSSVGSDLYRDFADGIKRISIIACLNFKQAFLSENLAF